MSSRTPRHGSCTWRREARAFDFLGFHHRWVRANRAKHVQFLARWPSRRAMQHACDRVREITARERLLLPVEDVVQDLNGYLRGWAGYFRYGNSARHFNLIEHHAHNRLALFMAKRHQRSRAYGWRLVTYSSRPFSAPSPTVLGRNEPNAGGEERRRAVCERTACTVRCGGGRKPDQSGQHAPRGPGASRRPYTNSDRASGSGAVTRRIAGFTVAPVSGESILRHRQGLFPQEVTNLRRSVGGGNWPRRGETADTDALCLPALGRLRSGSEGAVSYALIATTETAACCVDRSDSLLLERRHFGLSSTGAEISVRQRVLP